MDKNCIKAAPHPQLLEALFAFRSKVLSIFRDVLGIYEINHIAITQANENNQLLCFSSTPAMEYNLFNSKLWCYDRSYDTQWFTRCSQANWQSLYDIERYDELYYLKQIKHRYPLGYSLAAKIGNNFFIYSFASHRACNKTQEIFAHQHDDFYKIGQYCTSMLYPLFHIYGYLPPNELEYETSN